MKDVGEADAIFAVVNGVPPDEGVMVELGIAVALGKPTFLSETTSAAPRTQRNTLSTSCSSPVCRSTAGKATTTRRWRRLPHRRRCWPAGQRRCRIQSARRATRRVYCQTASSTPMMAYDITGYPLLMRKILRLRPSKL